MIKPLKSPLTLAQLGISSPLSASMPCPIPMPAAVAASVAPTSPTTTSSFSLRGYLPGETPQTVFTMNPTMTPVTTQRTPFMQAPMCEGGSTSGESGGSGASASSIPGGGQTLAAVHGTQLLAEQLLHHQQHQQQQRQQQQRLYEAALGLDSEGIRNSIQGGSKRDNESGGAMLQGDHVQVARALMAASGRYRHLATTQVEFLTAAEDWRC